MVTTRDRGLLLRAFAEWAKELGLSPHRHDAQYRGVVRDVLVEIETGVRESNLYRAVVAIHCSSGLAPQVFRDGAEQPGDAPLGVHLRSMMRRRTSVDSIRIDRELITLRMHPGSWPAEVGRVVDEVLSAVHASRSEQGPYR